MFPRRITVTDVYTHSKHMITTIRREDDRQASTATGRGTFDPTERPGPSPPPAAVARATRGPGRPARTPADLGIHASRRRGTGRTPPARQHRDVGYQQRHIGPL